MTTNKVSSESSFYFQLIHVNNIWNIKTVFMQYGYRLQWYGIFPLFLIQYLAQLGLLIYSLSHFVSFQADACHAYHIMNKHGIPDEQIVMMMYDDIANNRE